MGDPVGRPGLHRFIAPGELVPALRSGLDPLQAARDRNVDRLIIAQFEVQERPLDQRAPIAAIERVRPGEVERPGHRLPVEIGEDQHHAVPHPLPEQGEGFARQIGLAPLARACILIEFPERIPFRRADFGTGQHADLHPLLRCGAFLADVLALAR